MREEGGEHGTVLCAVVGVVREEKRKNWHWEPEHPAATQSNKARREAVRRRKQLAPANRHSKAHNES